MNEVKKGIFGGAFISLGAFAYLIVLQKTSNIFLASICFYLGLSLIMFFKQNLFTGQVFTKSDMKLFDYITTLTSTWVFNFVGAIITTLLLNQILHPDITQLIYNKLSLSPIQMIISGLFCNLLVCSAVASFNMTKNHIISGFFIMSFVLLGLEHSIANMTYITLGELQGVSINLNGVIVSLICVSFGNIIGGRIITHIVDSLDN
jgi:formate/nitrite transporter FocA (FNT family)